LASSVPHDAILDVGAGDGAVLARLDAAGFGERLSAVDISESAVSSIRRRGIGRLVAADTFDGYQLPYQDQQFDLVILSHVVEHVEHPRALLIEAARVGRHLFVEVPLEYTRRLPRHFQWTDTGHINYYSPKLIRYLLESTNLSLKAERISNPSLALSQFRYRRTRGLAHYFMREAALRCLPAVATMLFAYHYSALCESRKPCAEGR
jgi:ubiquinone/menaquinone biosynthesis C-methylase UbiE